MKKVFLAIIILFCGINLLMAQQNSKIVNAQGEHIAFEAGESLVFKVSYRAALIPNTDVAKVELDLSDTTYNNKKALKISTYAYVLPFFKWFFDLQDRYTTIVDPVTIRPYYAASDLSEGNYHFMSRLHFDWDNYVVNSEYRNLKRKNSKFKTMDLSEESYDGISLFYNLRSANVDDFTPGKYEQMQLVLEDTVRKVDYKYVGKEQIKVKGLGRFNTLKFSCIMVTTSGESFEDGTELFVWISDDKNHIPLYIETPVRVGSVRARLSEFSNLKHPLDSKIK